MRPLSPTAYLLCLLGSFLGFKSILNHIHNPLTANQEWFIGRIFPLRQKFQQLTLDLFVSFAPDISS
jgi:hypothetical protein